MNISYPITLGVLAALFFLIGPAFAGDIPQSNKNAVSEKYDGLAMVAGSWHKPPGSVCLRLGLEKMIMGDNKPSLQYLTKAIESNELNKDNLLIAHVNRAVLYTKLANYQEALRDLSIALEIDKNSYLAYYQRGEIYSKLNLFIDAAIEYTMAIEIKNNFAKAYYKRGMAWYITGNYSLAEKNFSQAINFAPNTADAYYFRCKTRELLGKTTEAKKDMVQYDLLRPLKNAPLKMHEISAATTNKKSEK